MPKKTSGGNQNKSVETLKHDDDKRKNIPTAEYQSVMQKNEQDPVRVAYERRNRDLDPQLVWRGKDEQDWSDLVVHAPPLYIQEKVHPKVLIDDLLRETRERTQHDAGQQFDLFADFNGIPQGVDKTEFYQHDQNWSNRMILGDSLQVMASLAEREGLRGKMQCIYVDPPYGIKFNSNFQWSTTSRDVKDGNSGHITREPEQVKAFRDTWRDGIHSYLTYLRDRLTVARDLLTDSGSIFVQIGDENVHRVRAVMDEVFGETNFVSIITLTKAASQSSTLLANINDFVLWFAKDHEHVKYRPLLKEKQAIERPEERYICIEEANGTIHDLSLKQKLGQAPVPEGRFLRMVPANSQTGSDTSRFDYDFAGQAYRPPGSRGWSTGRDGLRRLHHGGRLWAAGTTLMWKYYHGDYSFKPRVSLWDDIRSSGFGSDKVYVVQTQPEVIQRCILMATDPGDLVLDPTCGSGTTAFVAEQWGRRWITIDTSRVALALARARIMGARYPYYLLADSREGQVKEGEVTRTVPSTQPVRGNIRHGFVTSVCRTSHSSPLPTTPRSV
jgi:adenine-specific DNA-methyltransferase